MAICGEAANGHGDIRRNEERWRTRWKEDAAREFRDRGRCPKSTIRPTLICGCINRVPASTLYRLFSYCHLYRSDRRLPLLGSLDEAGWRVHRFASSGGFKWFQTFQLPAPECELTYSTALTEQCSSVGNTAKLSVFKNRLLDARPTSDRVEYSMER